MSDRSLEALAAVVGVLAERKAEELVVIDLRGRIPFADFFVICHGTSERQVRSLAEAVEGEVRERTGLRPRREGELGAEWVLLDYGDVLVHVFSEAGREYYRLDRLWGDAPHVDPASVLSGDV
ncbi:MAG: ribosome silencing factor [Acidobacteriota bacterium]|nr:MAG: ribosome silencing factor [Acidobacteriota bacterium]